MYYGRKRFYGTGPAKQIAATNLDYDEKVRDCKSSTTELCTIKHFTILILYALSQ
jgi:hypothetical protein